jgi:hypothetical protein
VYAGLALEPAATSETEPARVVESNVYEDLFPVGAVSSLPCHLHSGASTADGVADSAATAPASATPTVDAILQSAPSSPSGGSSRSSLVIERVRRGDGTDGTVIRQVPVSR